MWILASGNVASPSGSALAGDLVRVSTELGEALVSSGNARALTDVEAHAMREKARGTGAVRIVEFSDAGDDAGADMDGDDWS
ncbi:MAG: hypothetical protein AB7I01_01900 [Gammaproteobacteria bacterium]